MKLTKKIYTNIFIVTVVGDSNDADYITEVTKFKKENFDDEVIEEIKMLREIAGQAHGLEESDIEDTYVNLPYSDYGLCHSLEEIKIEFIDENSVIYDVEVE